ncbi:MAG TPA: hypothetical protein VJ963_01060 [Bacteroidales bacterium]|nr:hypothetical protein [Bacteroidales bacterium]
MIDELENIKKDIQEYIEVKLDLLRIQAAEIVSDFISKRRFLLVLVFLVSAILLFLSLSAAYFMASLLNSTELGFLCVAGFYFVLLMIFIILRKTLIDRPVIKSVMKIFFLNNRKNGKD